MLLEIINLIKSILKKLDGFLLFSCLNILNSQIHAELRIGYRNLQRSIGIRSSELFISRSDGGGGEVIIQFHNEISEL